MSANAIPFENEGFFLSEQLIADERLESLRQALNTLPEDAAGDREMLAWPWCAELAGHLAGHAALAGLVPPGHIAVQCTYFQKSTERNWLVPTHQDLSIPVAERTAHPALSGWSQKGEQLFVQPPHEILEQMLAIRLHLDDCTPEDGPLRVIPGSHRRGKLGQDEIQQARHQTPEVPCPLPAGAAMLMKPLLLHASSRASGNSRRRVLHFLYGPPELPYGLRWPTLV